MRIDSSGNVGIGTSSPSEQLHIYNTATKLKLNASGDASLLLTETIRLPFNVTVEITNRLVEEQRELLH